MAAGVAALVYATKPGLTPNQVKDIMFTTAKDLGTAGWDQYFGWGRIDATAAVNKAQGESTDTTAPSTPTNLIATAPDASVVNLSWSASVDNVAVTGYEIYRDGTKIATATKNSYVDKAVAPETSYSYYVKAFDGAGNMSGQSNTTTVTVPKVVFTISQNTVGNITSTSASVRVVTNMSSTATVNWGTDQTNLINTATDSLTGTIHDITVAGLTSRTTYYYQVTVTNAFDSNDKVTAPIQSFTTKKTTGKPSHPRK